MTPIFNNRLSHFFVNMFVFAQVIKRYISYFCVIFGKLEGNYSGDYFRKVMILKHRNISFTGV